MIGSEKHGYWWLPESPEKKVPGRLVFKEDGGAELHLLGAFRDTFEAFKQMGTDGKEYRPEVVLGLGEDGKNYSLYNCHQSGGRFTTSAFLRESFVPMMVMEGRHFETSEEMAFQMLAVRLSYLDSWHQKTGKTITIEDADSDKRKLTMTYQMPDAIVVHFDGGRIEMAHESNVNLRGDFAVNEKVFFYAFPDKPLHFIEFLNDFLPPIFYFFELGVGRPLSILEVQGKAAADCGDGTDEEIRKAPLVHLYWKKEKPIEEGEELEPCFMISARRDFGDCLEKHLQTWVKSHKEIKPVMELFFGKVLGRESYTSNSFLNSVQAAEAFHRYRRGGTELPDSDHSNRLGSIIDSCPDSHRQWLREKLRYSNEIGLRKRLKELLSERAELFGLSSATIKSIANRITEIRNYYTHYSGEKDPEFATGVDLYTFDLLMQWTVTACLLEEMGIPREKAHELIKRNQSFLRFKGIQLHKGYIELIKVERVSPEEAEAVGLNEPNNGNEKTAVGRGTTSP